MTKIEKIASEIKQINENYTMGFISPIEYVNQIIDTLRFVGLENELANKANEAMEPFAAEILENLTKDTSDRF